VNVTDSNAALTAVYNAFKGTADTTYADAMAQATAALTTNTLDALNAAKIALESVPASSMTVAQAQALGEKLQQVKDAIKAAEAAAKPAEIAQEVINAYKNYETVSKGNDADATAAAMERVLNALAAYKANKTAVDNAIANTDLASDLTTVESKLGNAPYSTATTQASTDAGTVNTAAGSLTTLKNKLDAKAALEALSDAEKAYYDAISNTTAQDTLAANIKKINEAIADDTALLEKVEAINTAYATYNKSDKLTEDFNALAAAVNQLTEDEVKAIKTDASLTDAIAAIKKIEDAADVDGTATFEFVAGKSSHTGSGTKNDPYVVTVAKDTTIASITISDYITATAKTGTTASAEWSSITNGAATYTVPALNNGEDGVYYFQFKASEKVATGTVASVKGYAVTGTGSYAVEVSNTESQLYITTADVTASEGCTIIALMDGADAASAKAVDKAVLKNSGSIYVKVQAPDGFSTNIVSITVTVD
jgi:hypothetical protein